MEKHLLSLAILSSLSLAATADDYQAGDILVRGGVTQVNPSSDQAGVYVEAHSGNTPLAATPFTHDITIQDFQNISLGVLGANVDVDPMVFSLMLGYKF